MTDAKRYTALHFPTGDCGNRHCGWYRIPHDHSFIVEVRRPATPVALDVEQWWAERYVAAHQSSEAGLQASREMARRANEVLARLSEPSDD